MTVARVTVARVASTRVAAALFALPSCRGAWAQPAAELDASSPWALLGQALLSLAVVIGLIYLVYFGLRKLNDRQLGADAEGPMRVQLWPDPKGFSRRAVRMAVRAEDAALVKPDGLVGRSIALLNLTALEELLYGDLAPGSYACELSLAVARYQADLAADLLDAWTPGATFRTEYDTAASGNDRYGSVDAVIRDLLAGAVVYTDRLRKHRIQRGLGAAAGEARAERTEATSSGLGLASIAENFRTLAELYELPYGFFDITPDVGGTMEYYMLGETAANIADSLALESRTLTEIAEEDGPMAAELRSFGELVLFHEAYFKTGLPSSIGLTTGFTSADGD